MYCKKNIIERLRFEIKRQKLYFLGGFPLDRFFKYYCPEAGDDKLLFFHHNLEKLYSQRGQGYTCVVVALPFRHGSQSCDSLPPEHGTIGDFVCADYYKTLRWKLNQVLKELHSAYGTKKKDTLIFVNSRLPEKLFALLGGRGLGQSPFIGRNSLLITPEYGSRVILGGVMIRSSRTTDDFTEGGLLKEPYEARADYDVDSRFTEVLTNLDRLAGQRCSTCWACVEACPTQAIRENGSINRDLCLQALATRYELLSEDIMTKWGRVIYGCRICQDVCPYNQNNRQGLTTRIGYIGHSVSVLKILELGLCNSHELRFAHPGRMGELFQSTGLGRRWMDPWAFVRNALIVAANLPIKDSPYVTQLLRAYQRKGHRILAETAAWTLRSR